ncbi:MAG TPA: hypothetical protein PLW93_00965 [Candidatus Absconditabacterales bacterium]|nr:hypothetical protein [Candidatus Absconditabacterales bacterium]HNG96822.1 hypothetical protein [Candidatus Absconditabacterales bacterium]
MKYLLIFLIGLVLGFVGAVKLHYLDLGSLVGSRIVTDTKPVNTGSIIQQFLEITPVKKIATLEVMTEHTLIDDYFQDFKILDFDTPQELDRLISQMTVSGKVKVNAIYGYTADQIQNSTEPSQRGEPKLLYYEIIQNNIDEVVVGLGITSNTMVKRVVNIVLQGIHDTLRKEFATNKTYMEQAKQNAIQKFGR